MSHGAGAARITISLGRVTYLDTAGVAVLVELTRWAKERGICLSLGEASEAARGALALTRLEGFFPPATGGA